MKFFALWRLSLRLLHREARSGELTLIALALLLAVTSATAIALFSARLDAAMQQRALDLLGADLRLESTLAIEPHWQQRAEALGLRHTLTTHFPSMIIHGDEMAMASVKAVTAGYPLKSELALAINAADVPQHSGPPVGEVWVETRLAALLDAQLGDSLEVGRSHLTLTGIISKESDRSAGFYSFAPRLMMNSADLAATELINDGSRVRWRLLLAGAATALAEFQQAPISAQQSFQTLENSQQTLAERLADARRYLGLAAMLAVVLACAAVAISAKHYAQRHFDISALIRTFGLSRRQVWQLYNLQLLQLGIVATLCGLGLALLVQEFLLALLADILPSYLPPAPLSAWLLGASCGLLGLLGFALPYLLPLSRVSPLKVLRRELAPMPMQGWLLSLIALLALAALLWLFTQDARLTLLTLVGTGSVLLLMFALVYASLSALQQRLRTRTLPIAWRFAWQQISHKKAQSSGKVLAFALTLMTLCIIGSLRTDLLADWQQQLPEDAPNVFAISLQPYEVDDFQQHLQQQGIEPQKLYATLPGRLTAINQESVNALAIADDPSIQRDLILTADSQLPANNQLTSGQWHGQSTEALGQVSVENKLAERLGIHLGDTLSFNLAGETVEVRVSSLRSVDWGSMTPNFFMIFSEDVLAQQPTTFMTSFHLAPHSQEVLTELIRAYPAATFFDTRPIIQQIQTLLNQVTQAIEWILFFVLLAAVLVLLASLVAGLPERLQESAILRALGSSRALLRRAQWLEFSILGLSAALLALAGAEAIRAVLYTQVLNLSWSSLGWAWLWLPLLAVAVFALPSFVLLRKAVNVPPLRVLRG